MITVIIMITIIQQQQCNNNHDDDNDDDNDDDDDDDDDDEQIILIMLFFNYVKFMKMNRCCSTQTWINIKHKRNWCIIYIYKHIWRDWLFR